MDFTSVGERGAGVVPWGGDHLEDHFSGALPGDVLLLPRRVRVIDDHHVLPVINVCVSLQVIWLTHPDCTR